MFWFGGTGNDGYGSSSIGCGRCGGPVVLGGGSTGCDGSRDDGNGECHRGNDESVEIVVLDGADGDSFDGNGGYDGDEGDGCSGGGDGCIRCDGGGSGYGGDESDSGKGDSSGGSGCGDDSGGGDNVGVVAVVVVVVMIQVVVVNLIINL